MSSIVDSRLLNSLPQLFPSLCTIQTYTVGRDSVGGETRTYSALYSNIPCVIAPNQVGVPAEAEVHRNDFTRSKVQPVIHTHHITLKGRFSSVRAYMRAIVSGTAYDIIAVENDSRRVMTRLLVREVDV